MWRYNDEVYVAPMEGNFVVWEENGRRLLYNSTVNMKAVTILHDSDVMQGVNYLSVILCPLYLRFGASSKNLILSDCDKRQNLVIA